MKDRKKNHIDLAFESQSHPEGIDKRFSYEPLLGAHPSGNSLSKKFLSRAFKVPFWVSSMTGGTELAGKINANLARACKEFGMGMGLGSCRILLEEDTYFKDFDMRTVIGDENALYANLGICQLEQSLLNGKTQKIHDLVNRLQADGLIIHVNPLQEWVQPEGDMLQKPPIETIQRFLDETPYKLIVKEVGQGMGKESLRKLLKLPLEAMEFAAYGGTNFAQIELLRRDPKLAFMYQPFTNVGVDANTMLQYVNELYVEEADILCKQIIISGGIKTFLDGYYLMSKSKIPAIYGQASRYLQFAKEDYEKLHAYIESQIKGLQMAHSFLTIKE